MDNGKENGDYYLGFRVWGLCVPEIHSPGPSASISDALGSLTLLQALSRERRNV